MIKLCDEFIEDHEPILFAKIGSRKMMLMEDIEIFGLLIKAEYTTDGGSIPRFAWIIDSPFTDGMLAYLVHDYRYSDVDNKNFTRSQADWELLCNLEMCGLNIIRRTLIYLAVVMFGWIFWNRNRKSKLPDGMIKHHPKVNLKTTDSNKTKEESLKP